MTEIVAVGNLLHPPHLREGEGEPPTSYAYAPIIVVDRVLRAGVWTDGPPIRLQLHVNGEQARNLAAVAQASGNVKVCVVGELRPRAYQAENGEQAVSLDIRVRELGISLRGQIADVTRPDGSPIGARRDDDNPSNDGQDSTG